MEKLDLHGKNHSDVKRLVESFLITQSIKERYFTVCIITGKSEKMKDLVMDVIKEHNFTYSRDILKGDILVYGN